MRCHEEIREEKGSERGGKKNEQKERRRDGRDLRHLHYQLQKQQHGMKLLMLKKEVRHHRQIWVGGEEGTGDGEMRERTMFVADCVECLPARAQQPPLRRARRSATETGGQGEPRRDHCRVWASWRAC